MRYKRAAEERKREGKADGMGIVRSLKPGRSVYCTMPDASEKDCNGFS